MHRSSPFTPLVRLGALLLACFAIAAEAGWKDAREALDQRFVHGEFRIYYTLEGNDAFPLEAPPEERRALADTYLQELARQLDDANRFYGEVLGLTPPLAAARYRHVASIDIHILALEGKTGSSGDDVTHYRYRHFGDSGPVLTITLSNRWRPTGLTPAHELFHSYQYGYTFFKNRWFLEGMARAQETPLRRKPMRMEPLPQTIEQWQTLLSQTYDAERLWHRLAYLCDRECGDTASGAPMQFTPTKTVCGGGMWRAVLEELQRADQIAARAFQLNEVNWPEGAQRAEANNPYLAQGLRRALIGQCQAGANAELGVFFDVLREAGAAGASESTPQALGDPFATAFARNRYAKNIWTMRFDAGLLYLGAGNSSNKPPAANAGPVPLIAYDPRSGRFQTEAVIDEEQIDRILRIGERLCIPGHDPREDWSFGNIHCRRDDGRWEKMRTLPGVLHAYDLAEYRNTLVAAVAIRSGAALAVSRDRGNRWSVQPLGYGRTYGLLRVGGTLYAAKIFLPAAKTAQDPDRYYAVAEIGPAAEASPRHDLGAADLFPDTRVDDLRMRKLVRPLSVGDEAFYIGAFLHNDHQATPFGLYRAVSLARGKPNVRRIALPGGFQPWDIALSGETLFVLTNRPVQDEYEAAVFALKPASDAPPVQLLSFRVPTFARSFALDDTAFYFGLGCETERAAEDAPLSPACGQFLRLPRTQPHT